MKEIKVICAEGTDIEGDTYYSLTEEGIQKAIDYAKDKGRGKIFITKGTYFIDNPLLITSSHIEICGEGKATILTYRKNSSYEDNHYMKIKGEEGKELTNIILRDLYFKCSEEEDTGNTQFLLCEWVGKSYPLQLTTDDEEQFISCASKYNEDIIGADKECFTGITIKDCTFYGRFKSYPIIQIKKCCNCTTVNNDIRNSEYYSLDVCHVSNSKFQYNFMHDTGSYNTCASFLGSYDNNVSYNHFMNNNGGLKMYRSLSTIIHGNTSCNNSEPGMASYVSIGDIITSNIVCNNKHGGMKLGSSCTIGLLCAYNIANNNGAPDIYNNNRGEPNIFIRCSHSHSANVYTNIVNHGGGDGIVLMCEGIALTNANLLNNNERFGIEMHCYHKDSPKYVVATSNSGDKNRMNYSISVENALEYNL